MASLAADRSARFVGTNHVADEIAAACQASIDGDESASDFPSCRAREWKCSPIIRGEKMAMNGKLHINTYNSATSP
jgi:hypothetical protein